MKNLLMIFFITILVIGCASVGKNFDETKVSEIQKNVTTKEQVKTMFGEPDGKGFDSSLGLDYWNYSFYETKSNAGNTVASILSPVPVKHRGETNFKSLRIYFNEDGTVKNYDYNTSSQKTEAGFGL